jgi:hypothetical protein
MLCVRWQVEGLLISRLPLSHKQAHREVAPVAAAGGGHLAAQDLGVPPLSAERGEAEVELAAAATEAAAATAAAAAAAAAAAVAAAIGRIQVLAGNVLVRLATQMEWEAEGTPLLDEVPFLPCL